MKHSYTVGCVCRRCERELARRTKQSAADFAKRPVPSYRRADGTDWRKTCEPKGSRRPVPGTQEWAETRGDDLGESPDY